MRFPAPCLLGAALSGKNRCKETSFFQRKEGGCNRQPACRFLFFFGCFRAKRKKQEKDVRFFWVFLMIFNCEYGRIMI